MDFQIRLNEGNEAIRNLVQTTVSTAIRNHLRAVAEKNVEIVSHFYLLSKQGVLTEDEAKARAAEVLLSQTIGSTGYIFCMNSDSTALIHPDKQLQGMDLSHLALSERLSHAKTGYFEYDWANPGEPAPRAKASYLAYFEPWDWIIAASSYRDEFLELVPLKELRQGIREHTFGDSGYAYVIDKSGKIIIHPKFENLKPGAIRGFIDKKYFQDVLKRRNGVLYYKLQDPGETSPRDKVAIFSEIPELGWIIFSSGYMDEFRRPLRVLLYGMGGATVTILVILVVLTWWFGNFMTKPLTSFMNILEQSADGDLSLRMVESGSRELRRLARFYNNFMDSLEVSQKQLADSEEKYRIIFENAVEGMFRFHIDEGLIEANPAMAHIFGYEDVEQILTEVTNPAEQLYVDPGGRAEVLRALTTHGQIVGLVLRFKRRDQSEFMGEISARAVQDESGRILYTDGFIKDVSAQFEALEAITRAKEEAEAASRLKSNFLSLVSHELRTPLTSIQGFTKRVGKQLGSVIVPALDESRLDAKREAKRAIENMRIVEDEGKRLQSLIDDVLILSQAQSGELVVSPSRFDPVVILTLVVESKAAVARTKGVGLIASVEQRLPEILADEKFAVEVLARLVDNGLKFTSGGTVTVSATLKGEFVEFMVQDTGPGIPQKSLDGIFDKFTQGGDIDVNKPIGLGLGLALCRELVVLQGGQIRVESTVGYGSSFFFTLPVAGKG
ncbi:cache domain-containing protein [uncultured Pseudodesulfovibrio sp.]|uniref:cache domain-containing protein n=1 Tax=uncultured Pseudodesulfovibrio sp. TaxID=2035858 RepID=UPI00374845DA